MIRLLSDFVIIMDLDSFSCSNKFGQAWICMGSAVEDLGVHLSLFMNNCSVGLSCLDILHNSESASRNQCSHAMMVGLL